MSQKSLRLGSASSAGKFRAADPGGAAPVVWFGMAARPRLAYPLLAFAAVGYSVVAFELSLAHALPMPAPYLRISDADYFFWATFFYAPVIAAAWLLASAAMYLLTRLAGRKVDFDRMLTATALASGAGTLATLIPDLITSPLRAAGVIDEGAWELSIATQGGWFFFTWVTLVAYVVVFVAGYSLATRAVTGARWPASLAIGVAGFVVFQAFEYVFIR